MINNNENGCIISKKDLTINDMVYNLSGQACLVSFEEEIDSWNEKY